MGPAAQDTPGWCDSAARRVIQAQCRSLEAVTAYDVGVRLYKLQDGDVGAGGLRLATRRGAAARAIDRSSSRSRDAAARRRAQQL